MGRGKKLHTPRRVTPCETPCGAVWRRVALCAVCRPPCAPPCDAVRRRVALRAVCWSPCAPPCDAVWRVTTLQTQT
eukprot:gene12729-biopygen7608